MCLLSYFRGELDPRGLGCEPPQMDRPIVGRLAPSPTGALHLGHARSFLLAFWHARSRGGRLVLRLEDVDVLRSSDEHVRAALDDLHWLGLSWDGEPVIQTQHRVPTQLAADELLRLNLAYPCICSRKDLREDSGREVQGAPQQGTVEVRYPGTCRGRYRSLEQAEKDSGRAAGLRLLTRDEPTSFVDGVFGPQTFNVQRQVGDFLILRRDRSPAYQLAVTVSDLEDGVTEVVRGEDLLASTARQILLYRALGRSAPDFAHLPLVCDASGRRFAKRHDDLSLRDLRVRGVDPRAVATWAARTSGQLPADAIGGLFGASELIAGFDLRKMSRQPVLVDETDWQQVGPSPATFR